MFRRAIGLIALVAAGVGLQSLMRPAPLPAVANAKVEAAASVTAPNDPPRWSRGLGDDPLVSPDGVYLDVSLFILRSFTQVGRQGTFPTGRTGFAMSTTSCNVGNVRVPWFAPMDPRHPFIGQNLYRINGEGRLEQIGLAWMKHAFFAADSIGCGDCFPNLFDDHLNIGCQDTYGTGNNSDRQWLGPRSEIDPMTADWDPCGSHFDIGDGSKPDCQRSHSGLGHDAVDHLVRVTDEDLNDPSSEFFFEAFYIVADDQNIYNNWAHKQTDPTWSGSRWNTSDVGDQIGGPIVMRWGDMQNFSSPASEGDAITAVRVIDLRGGQFRYEFAVLNNTVTRQIESFSVPVDAGVNVTNIGFHAPIEDEELYSFDPWTSSVANGAVTWTTDDFSTNEFANSLRYGTVYTFWFEADSPPQLSTATMEVFQPGGADELTTSTLGPAGGTPSGFGLEAPQIAAGQPVTFTAWGVQPGERVHFAYSTRGLGRTTIPQIGLTVDLETPITYLGNAIADSGGVATIDLSVPSGAPAIDVAIQAVVVRSSASIKSNPALRTVQN
ncbi:MAG: hypothetical protein ACF8PN_00670 [Phycisphaerales bacterium]